MGRLMRERGFIPDAVFSSPATRARETAKLACEAAEIKQPIKFDERIYEAGASTLAKVVSETDPKAGSAMIVGHNPGMEGLIRFLTGEAAAMPTAALAVIDLEIDDWAEISSGCGRLVKVLRPKTVGYLT
jgi:phosphohistidine phosphatase